MDGVMELGMGIEPITVGDIAKNNLFYAAPFSFFNIKVSSSRDPNTLVANMNRFSLLFLNLDC
jgi:hypothetical protein